MLVIVTGNRPELAIGRGEESRGDQFYCPEIFFMVQVYEAVDRMRKMS